MLLRSGKWLPGEVSFLKRYYRTFSTHSIALELNRSEAAVGSKARRLGLKKPDRATLKKLAERRRIARGGWAKKNEDVKTSQVFAYSEKAQGTLVQLKKTK